MDEVRASSRAHSGCQLLGECSYHGVLLRKRMKAYRCKSKILVFSTKQTFSLVGKRLSFKHYESQLFQ